MARDPEVYMDPEKLRQLMQMIREGQAHMAAVIAQSLGMPSDLIYGDKPSNRHGPDGFSPGPGTSGPNRWKETVEAGARPMGSFEAPPFGRETDLGGGQTLITPLFHKPPTPVKDFAAKVNRKRERKLR